MDRLSRGKAEDAERVCAMIMSYEVSNDYSLDGETEYNENYV
jgi:hypothetical protein